MNSLNIDNLNAKSQYKVSALSDCRYQFVTDSQILYHLVFDEDEPIGGVPTYQFSIVNVSKKPSQKDPGVKEVIMAVLEAFFEMNSSVVLYICDTSDGRQSVRARLFKKWFMEQDNCGKYIILTDSLIDEGIKNEFGIIFERNNLYADSVISDFEYMTNSFRQSK